MASLFVTVLGRNSCFCVQIPSILLIRKRSSTSVFSNSLSVAGDPDGPTPHDRKSRQLLCFNSSGGWHRLAFAPIGFPRDDWAAMNTMKFRTRNSGLLNMRRWDVVMLRAIMTQGKSEWRISFQHLNNQRCAAAWPLRTSSARRGSTHDMEFIKVLSLRQWAEGRGKNVKFNVFLQWHCLFEAAKQWHAKSTSKARHATPPVASGGVKKSKGSGLFDKRRVTNQITKNSDLLNSPCCC